MSDTKLWYDGEKTYTIIFTDEDLKVILRILENGIRSFNPQTDEEKSLFRVKSRIYFQMGVK